MQQSYHLIPMANNNLNAVNGRRPIPSLADLAKHFEEVFDAPRDANNDDPLRASFNHAQESRGWK